MTVADAKKRIAEALAPTSPTPQLDADCILQWVLGCDRTRLLLRRNDMLTDAQADTAQKATEKRKTGFPIAYITGKKEFFGYDFYVSPAVLIPKPDTELLVEQAISAVREKLAATKAADFDRRNRRGISVCDMCAGSGCVGLSVMKALTESAGNADATDRADKTDDVITLTLVDVSADALAVARNNAGRLLSPVAQERTSFVQSNLFARVLQKFDIIVTNPPYVPHTEAILLLQDGRSEPLLALDGDVTETGDSSGTNDGLSLIRRLVPQAHAHLNDGGVLLMETGEYNAEETARLFAQTGLRNVRIERDLSGQLRDVIGYA